MSLCFRNNFFKLEKIVISILWQKSLGKLYKNINKNTQGKLVIILEKNKAAYSVNSEFIFNFWDFPP